jgi:hypothetical protein
LFHYLPPGATTQELRAVVVEAGNAVPLSRGIVHTFGTDYDLTLLSYHSPFIEFNDNGSSRFRSLLRSKLKWRLAGSGGLAHSFSEVKKNA